MFYSHFCVLYHDFFVLNIYIDILLRIIQFKIQMIFLKTGFCKNRQKLSVSQESNVLILYFLKLKNNIFIKFQIVFFSSRYNGNVRYFGWNVRFCCNFISNAFLRYLRIIKVYNKVAPTDSKNQTYEKKLNGEGEQHKNSKIFCFYERKFEQNWWRNNFCILCLLTNCGFTWNI